MKTWCEHIKVVDELFYHTDCFDVNGTGEIPADWTCCPLCKIERPRPPCVEHHFMSFKGDSEEVCIKCGTKRPTSKKKGRK